MFVCGWSVIQRQLLYWHLPHGCPWIDADRIILIVIVFNILCVIQCPSFQHELVFLSLTETRNPSTVDLILDLDVNGLVFVFGCLKVCS